MKLNEAKRLTGGGLGYPSKMPGTSYGLSAHKCITGAKLAAVPGSVCHGCYALKGNYIYSSVKKAHEARLASLANPQWTAAMVRLLDHSGTRHHRWHDSGDLQSVAHLTKIAAVAALTPAIAHWLPTRELAIVQAYTAQGGTVPVNLTIRVSAAMVDGPATRAWPTTSGVHTHVTSFLPLSGDVPPRHQAHVCPAPQQANKCGPCRACWSPTVAHVSYPQH